MKTWCVEILYRSGDVLKKFWNDSQENWVLVCFDVTQPRELGITQPPWASPLSHEVGQNSEVRQQLPMKKSYLASLHISNTHHEFLPLRISVYSRKTKTRNDMVKTMTTLEGFLSDITEQLQNWVGIGEVTRQGFQREVLGTVSEKKDSLWTSKKKNPGWVKAWVRAWVGLLSA